MPNKDYYAILGVLPSIDQAALQAVYRALVKKYHPDVFKGIKSEAERITKELNEAYSVLGDEKKRAEYDKRRKEWEKESGDYDTQSRSDSKPESEVNEIAEAWEYIVQYYPKAEQCRAELAKLSASLAFTFQIAMIEGKTFSAIELTKSVLERSFLERYFGKSAKIQMFAKIAILDGRIDVALEVNKAIKYLGTPDSGEVDRLLKQIRDKMSYLKGHAPKKFDGDYLSGLEELGWGILYYVIVVIVICILWVALMFIKKEIFLMFGDLSFRFY